jgi:hypothetical protein
MYSDTVSGLFAEVHFIETHFAEAFSPKPKYHFIEWTFRRTEISPNGHLQDSLPNLPIGHFIENGRDQHFIKYSIAQITNSLTTFI